MSWTTVYKTCMCDNDLIWIIWFNLSMGLPCLLVLIFVYANCFLQRYMDSEIRAIMAQYMPLDNQGEVPNHVPHGNVWEWGDVETCIALSPTFDSLWGDCIVFNLITGSSSFGSHHFFFFLKLWVGNFSSSYQCKSVA